MIEFGKSIFVCSKPLQFLICCSISRKFKTTDTEIHIITKSFTDHTNFIEFIKNTNSTSHIKSIHTHNTHAEAAQKIKDKSYDSLFIEDDRASLYYIFSPLKKKYLSVFEEGFGTYQGDYPEKFTGLKKIKWNILSKVTGCGIQFGDGRKTDFVIVQYPEIYITLNRKNKNKALEFPGIIDEINTSIKSWEYLLSNKIQPIANNKTNAKFVLATWGRFCELDTSTAQSEQSTIFYKKHPHRDSVLDLEIGEIIDKSWIPAEACITVLSKFYKTIDVYHLSSSTEFYCNKIFKNVIFHDLLNDKRFRLVMNTKLSILE